MGTPFNPAFDAATHPELFQGVLRRRIAAFILDALIITLLWILAVVVVLVLGVLTLGLAWLLIGAIFPIVGLGYNAMTVGGPNQSTIGMRQMGLTVKMWHGGTVSPLIGAFHALLFWLSLTIFFPILLWPIIDRQKRCLHDIFAGVVLVRDR
ncbi:RDD family protein [Methyloligella sp. GL2]|nr:RDD family protein [Methyloligella sp. GL2]